MKYLKMILILAMLPTVFMACNDDDPIDPQNIVDIAVANPDFSILVDALTKADLATTLEGTGPFTVFAPTNAAFSQLFTDLGVSGVNDLSAAALTPILLNHVIGAEVLSAGLSNGYVSTLSTGPDNRNISLKVDVTSGVLLNNSINVTSADVDATNGVLHIVDKVIVPPTVVDIALQNSDFSTLVAALTRSDLTTDFVSILNGAGPFTVFAPTNQAFQNLLDSDTTWMSLDDIPVATLEAVLSYHVINGSNIISSQILDGTMVTTFQGTDLTTVVTGADVGLTDGQLGTSNVVAVDVQGSNGVVHVIDRVLLP